MLEIVGFVARDDLRDQPDLFHGSIFEFIHINTAGSLFDTLLAVYTGSRVYALGVIAANDDVGGTNLTSSLIFDGTRLAEKGVVLVTANYRLGVLGFLAHPAP